MMPDKNMDMPATKTKTLNSEYTVNHSCVVFFFFLMFYQCTQSYAVKNSEENKDYFHK